jgi:hypothetical protein
VIRIGDSVRTLSPRERFGLDLLVDLSRVVIAEDDSLGAVVLQVVRDESPIDLKDLVKGRWSIARSDGMVQISSRALHWVADVAGAGIEQRSLSRDPLGRVPASENPLVRAGLEREPVISQGALLLREEVLRAAGGRTVRIAPAWPLNKLWAMSLTHDLDGVEWWPIFSGVRLLESLKRRNARLALRVLSGFGRSIGRDPLGDGARNVLAFSKELEVSTTWFVLCGSPTLGTILQGDVTYDPDRRPARSIIGQVIAGGHEIGLHGSFETFRDPGELARQKRRLEEISGRVVSGVRQHFLKMRPGLTQRGMHEAGFTFDSTYGFPDRNGFRLGAADVLEGWDDAQQVKSGIDEIPFTWMDRSLSKYRGIDDPGEWIRDAGDLAESARKVGGHFASVWHPHLTSTLGYPGAFNKYQELVQGLLRNDPYCAPLERIVRWRRARRSIRIRGRRAGGDLQATMCGAWGEKTYLEDAHGEQAEPVEQAPRS